MDIKNERALQMRSWLRNHWLMTFRLGPIRAGSAWKSVKQIFLLVLFYVSVVAAGSDSAAANENDDRSTEWPPTDPARLLERLRHRDAQFENRILKIEERSVERIDPRAMLAQQKFNDMRFGQRNNTYPSPETLPDAYDQPHRKLQELIVREPEVTLKTIRDLEKRINPKYGAVENRGFIWSTIGGIERSYSPSTNTLHLMGEPSSTGVLRMHQRAFEWCTGHGFADLMTSIRSIDAREDNIVIRGDARLFQDDRSTMELELDRDLIVRRAVVSIPSRPNGFNQYRVTTFGAVRPNGAPAVAERGISQRVLMPVGKPERNYTKYDVAFVSLSNPLSDDEYAKATKIEPAPGTRTVDMRPRKRIPKR